MCNYIIRGGQAGKARLNVLARALEPTTDVLFRRAGLRPGMRCLDLGCGGGDVAMQLARFVGPRGAVVGMDMDRVKLELARQDAADARLSTISFREGDVTRLDVHGAFDLVYARFLLTHMRDPQELVERMLRAARPGGLIVIEDIDHSGVFSYPACAALGRHIELYNQLARLKGADPEIGPRLPGLLRQGGALQVQLTMVQPTFMAGEPKRLHQLTLASIAEGLIENGLATAAEIEELHCELDAFTSDPHTLIGLPRIFQAWGYRATGELAGSA
jgi:SAM-dependent methyltransferase